MKENITQTEAWYVEKIQNTHAGAGGAKQGISVSAKRKRKSPFPIITHQGHENITHKQTLTRGVIFTE